MIDAGYWLFTVCDAIRKLVGKAPNKAFKYNSKKILRKVINELSEREYIDLNGIRIPRLRDASENAIFTEELILRLYPYLCCGNKFTEHVHSLAPGKYYGIQRGDVDISVKSGDVVIDARAWVGEFAAYAAHLGAHVYAFEASPFAAELLAKTAELNEGIICVNSMLSDSSEPCRVSIYNDPQTNNLFTVGRVSDIGVFKSLPAMRLDDFVREQAIPKVDFIKVDLQELGRNVLLGAKDTIRRFRPRIAASTIYTHDDEQVFQQIILDADKRYRFVHIPGILFADAR